MPGPRDRLNSDAPNQRCIHSNVSNELLLIPVVAALLLACTDGSRTAEKVKPITIGVMRPGTSWYVFAATLATLLERELPPGTPVEVIARGGGYRQPDLGRPRRRDHRHRPSGDFGVGSLGPSSRVRGS